jgi:hypothetical protein
MPDRAEKRPTDGFRARQYEFAAHLRDPDRNPAPADVEDRRMQIYRELFFNNVVGFLGDYFPVLIAILGEERWKLLVRDYYRDHVSHTPLFPEMVTEFLQYLAEERAGGERSDPEPDPPFMHELALYEWIKSGLKLADDDAADELIDPAGDLLDARPVVSGVAWGLSFTYAVDQISKTEQPEGPADEPLHFLIYRNGDDKVIWSRLNAVSARLFALLDDESPITGRAALERIVGELRHPSPDKVVENGLQIMEQWRELGVIRGTLPA